MSQFLRPDSNVTQTRFTGGYAEIDESSANDADLAYANATGTSTLEVGLSNPGGAPSAGTVTIRYRVAKTDNAGSPNGSGPDSTFNAYLYEGATLIDSDTTRTISSASFTTFTWNPNTAGVSDWSDLRLRFTATYASNRGSGISWAELEAPDSLTHYNMPADGGTFTLTGADATFPVTRRLDAQPGAFALTGAAASLVHGYIFQCAAGSFALNGSAVNLLKDLRLPAAAGAFVLTGADAGLRADYVMTAEATAFDLTGGDVLFHIRERNGWDIPKAPVVTWNQAGSGGSGGWAEVVPSDVDWTLQ